MDTKVSDTQSVDRDNSDDTYLWIQLEDLVMVLAFKLPLLTGGRTRLVEMLHHILRPRSTPRRIQFPAVQIKSIQILVRILYPSAE